MNVPTESPVLHASTKPITEVADCLRRHPGGTLLVAAGLGFAAVLIARAMMPPPPQNRAMRTLEDILYRLRRIAQPAYDRAVDLAEDGAHAVGKGVHGLGDLHLDRKFDKVWRGFTGLFH